MQFPNREALAATRRYRGRRVKLVYTADQHARVPVGTLGTVTFVDAVGTVFVDWDSGHSLGMIEGVDRFAWVNPPGEAA